MGTYKKYSNEFKRDVLAMVAAGERSVSQIERELDITPGLIYKWQQRYRMVEEKLQPSAERAEQAEIRRLKRELDIQYSGCAQCWVWQRVDFTTGCDANRASDSKQMRHWPFVFRTSMKGVARPMAIRVFTLNCGKRVKSWASTGLRV